MGARVDLGIQLGQGNLDLCVIILTYNEERHIVRAIESVQGVASRVVIVDSFSSDNTVELARVAGAEVYKNKFVNQAVQFQWALDTIKIDNAWVMRLDADEIVPEELRVELREVLRGIDPDVTGLRIKRRHIFLGRWIRHGGRYPLVLLRIWRNGAARVEDRWMDEHAVLNYGRSVHLKSDFIDDNLNDLTFFTAKHNSYATREAVQIILESLRGRKAEGVQLEALSQANIKRQIKTNIYNKLPFGLGSCAYFLYRFIFKLGFLDGVEGAIYHFLQGFWYRFLVEAKLFEFRRCIAGEVGTERKIARLREVSGLNV